MIPIKKSVSAAAETDFFRIHKNFIKGSQIIQHYPERIWYYHGVRNK